MSIRYIPIPAGARIPGFLEPAELTAERERRKLNSWFLMRNNGEAGERWICDPAKGGCGVKHEYFTLRCIPRPFNGIIEMLLAFVETRPEDPRAQKALLPLMSIAERHPETTRLMRADPEAHEIWSISIGLREEIEPWRAKLFVDQINSRRPMGGPLRYQF